MATSPETCCDSGEALHPRKRPFDARFGELVPFFVGEDVLAAEAVTAALVQGGNARLRQRLRRRGTAVFS